MFWTGWGLGRRWVAECNREREREVKRERER